MPPNIKLIIAAAAIGALVIVGGVAWVLGRRRRIKPDSQSTGHAEDTPFLHPSGSALFPGQDLASDLPKQIATADLAKLSANITDPDIRQYLIEIAGRVEESGPIFDANTPFGFIEEIIDRLDDLKSIQKGQPIQVASEIDSFRNILSGILTECCVDPIHCEQWDATIQRAVKKEPTPGITAPKILCFGATGIRRNGELVRKQEVVLAVPVTQ